MMHSANPIFFGRCKVWEDQEDTRLYEESGPRVFGPPQNVGK